MSDLAFVNGQIVPLNEAKISILDRGFQYGDGLFETIRVYHGKPFLIQKHLERLEKGAKEIGIKFPPWRKIEKAIEEILNSRGEKILKIILTRGIGKRSAMFKDFKEPSLIVYTEDYLPLPENFYLEGVKALLLPENRSFFRHLKSLNFLPNLLSREESCQQGFYEVIYYDQGGFITEGTITNIFFVKYGTLYTPSLDLKILPGVTRSFVFNLALSLGFKVKETHIRKEGLAQFEEAFLTNSIIEILPLSSINENCFKIGKLTLNLINAYRNAVLNL